MDFCDGSLCPRLLDGLATAAVKLWAILALIAVLTQRNKLVSMDVTML